MLRRLRLLPVLLLVFATMLFTLTVYAAPNFANFKFRELWQYSDKLVDEVPGAGRGFTWGPNDFGTFQEPYQESKDGLRQVQYFDKSRMELSSDGNLVTNGLLTKELVTGNRQDGNATFTQLAPSIVQVAGDDNSGGGNAVSPVYASFKNVVTFNPGENTATNRVGQYANLAIDKAGNVSNLDNSPAQLVIGAYENVLGHNVPKVFVDFQNLTVRVWNGFSYINGKVYTDNPVANVFGYAISEPYWAKAVVAGQEKDVLIQLFERRVLTYTPSNPVEFRVEMGNIGQHYYSWRYVVNAPKPYSYNGSGNKVIQGLNLSQGVSRFIATHNCSRNFIVTVKDAAGKLVDLPFNEIGTYSGSVYVSIPKPGVYSLEIQGDGAWKIDVLDMGVIRNESPQAASKYTGKGDAAFKIKFPKTGAVVFKFKYVGKSNFIVTIYDKNGKLDDLLANEINDYTGETMFSAGSGDYYIEVIATGDWTIQIT